MDWLFDNIQILFIIAAAVAYWLNTLRAAREEAQEDHRREQTPVDVEDIFGPDFDFRESAPQTETFLPPPVTTSTSASGPPPLPGQATPPPTPAQRQRREFPSANPMPQRPTAPRSPHEAPTAKSQHDDELARQRSLMERIQSLRQNRDKRESGAAGTKRTVKAKDDARRGIEIEPTADPTSLVGIRSRLKDPRETRRAIVMREILGTPVSLR